MADRKISDLTALTAPASGDYLPIVDISEVAAASKNKRITIEELFRGIPLGTAAAPSIAIEGDEDTGIYSPGANQLAVATNGTGRLFVDSSGRVGIGTSSPVGRLHAVAATTNAALTLTTPDLAPARLVHLSGGNNYSYGVIGVASGDTTQYGDAFSLGSSSNPTGSFSPTLTWTTNNGQNQPGRVGIGTTSPSTVFDVKTLNGSVGITHAGSIGTELRFRNTSGTTTASIFNYGGSNETLALVADNGAGQGSIVFQTLTSERARIDSSGRLLVGTSSAVSSDGGTTFYAINQFSAGNVSNQGIFLENGVAGGGHGRVVFAKNRGGAAGGTTIVLANDVLGANRFFGADGTGYKEAAAIVAEVDGTPGTNDMPGRLVFSTTADGANSPTERMRISNDGAVKVAGDNFQIATSKTPASATATGTAGQIAWDADYIYVCTATNTWKRSALATW